MSTIVTQFSLGDQVQSRARTDDYRQWAVGCVAEIQIRVGKHGSFIEYLLAFVDPKSHNSWNPWFAEDELEGCP